MIALILQLAVAGANTTSAGWLTIVLPLGLVVIVFGLWWVAVRRSRS
jgi:cytochrome c-type biogenesis protein CcmH/NrfF